MAYSVIDLHADTPDVALARYRDQSNTLQKSHGHIDLPRLRQGGSLLQAMAIFAPAQPMEYMPREATPAWIFDRVYTAYQAALKEYADEVRPVYAYEDIRRNQAAGKLSFLLTLEDGAVVDGKMEKLDELAEKGVRVITLTWNYENCFGSPNSAAPEKMTRGLTAFGKEAVQYMQERNVIVDVSHLSDGGFWDVAQLCKKPFVATHSNCRALCGHRRNLTDEMLRTLADHGGVAGINFCAPFLAEGANFARTEDMVRHMQHMKNVAGIETIALGSDFDGIDNEIEFGDCAGLPQLFQACEKVFTPRELDLITHENALRVLRDCMPRD